MEPQKTSVGFRAEIKSQHANIVRESESQKQSKPGGHRKLFRQWMTPHHVMVHDRAATGRSWPGPIDHRSMCNELRRPISEPISNLVHPIPFVSLAAEEDGLY